MIREYFILNKDKIKFGLKWNSILFVSIVLIAFSLGRFYGQKIEWSLFITTLLLAGIFFPIFIWTLAFVKDFMIYKRTRDIIGNYPFNELTKNGFKQYYEFQDNRWFLLKLKLQGQFDDLKIECDVDNSTFKIIAITGRAKREHIKKLKKEFGKNKIEYDWLGVAMSYNTKREKTSFDQLKNDLTRFIEFFKMEKLDT